jgi:beta-mannosidase
MNRKGNILLISLLFSFSYLELSGQQATPLNWELGYNEDPASVTLKWIPATVPGAVQLDVARAEKYDTWYYGENWKDYLWMEDVFFTYRAAFSKPNLKDGERVYFYSRGIDYNFDILLNDEKIFRQEGMFTPVKIDITDKLESRNVINVVIHPIPKSRRVPAGRSQADHSVKPAVSYGWDWHPRLVPSGIWDETGLEISPGSSISTINLDYRLNHKLDKADISCIATGRDLTGCRYVWTLTNDSNRQVFKRKDSCLIR